MSCFFGLRQNSCGCSKRERHEACGTSEHLRRFLGAKAHQAGLQRKAHQFLGILYPFRGHTPCPAGLRIHGHSDRQHRTPQHNGAASRSNREDNLVATVSNLSTSKAADSLRCRG